MSDSEILDESSVRRLAAVFAKEDDNDINCLKRTKISFLLLIIRI